MKNPGCDYRIWYEFTEQERKLWARLFTAFNRSFLLPPGISMPRSSIREIAQSFATQAIWSLQAAKREGEYK